MFEVDRIPILYSLIIDSFVLKIFFLLISMFIIVVIVRVFIKSQMTECLDS